MVKFLEPILVIYSILAVTLAEPPCHITELGTCLDNVVNYINTLPKRVIPHTEDEVNNMCNVITDGADCFDNYRGRCMTPLQNELENLVTEGARDLQKKFCSPGSDLRQSYLKHSPCLVEVLATDQTSQYIDQVVVMFEKLDGVIDSRKIRYVCCGWNSVFSSVWSMAKDKCGDEAVSSLNQLLTLAISDLPNILCDGFEADSAQCKKILPPLGSEPDGSHNPFVDAFRYFFKAHLD